jgi:hypothetical protein
MKLKREDRESTATLVITAAKDGTLSGQWKSQRGQLEISNVQYSRGTLNFAMKSSNPDRQFQANFEGTLRRDALSGTMKSERGEMTVEGTRAGADLIGTWNLETTSERGTRKGRLRVNPDMSALYGAMAVKKVGFENGQVTFKITRTFGDREFEISLQAKIQDGKLVGELTTPMGSQKLTGTKVVRRRRSM